MLAHLDEASIRCASLVCRGWRDAAKTPLLWEAKCLERGFIARGAARKVACPRDFFVQRYRSGRARAIHAHTRLQMLHVRGPHTRRLHARSECENLTLTTYARAQNTEVRILERQLKKVREEAAAMQERLSMQRCCSCSCCA